MTTSIHAALKYVAEHPEPSAKDTIDQPVWELVGRALFAVANGGDPKIRGSVARATRAMKIISNRLVGTRRTGSHPVARQTEGIVFHDLTSGEITL